MIWGAALLVLAGLGLFAAGAVTEIIELYWACVAVCGLAAILLVAGRRQTTARTSGTAVEQPTAGGASAVRTARAGTVPPGVDDRNDVRPVPPVSSRTQQEAEPVERTARPTEPSTGGHTIARHGPATGAAAVGAPSFGDTASGAPATGPVPAQGRGGAHAAADQPRGGAADRDEPGIEEVEVTDLLLVVDLTDEVLVVDEHPRYHLAGCRFLRGRQAIPLPLDEARTDGFTPCAVCTPDRHLADRERARR